MAESFPDRWRRRAVSIPVMLGATAVGLVGLPILLPLAVAVDVVSGRLRFPTVRAYLFVLQYLVNDSFEILVAPGLWVLAGFGRRLGSSRSRARHQRIQDWSVRTLAGRADQLLGLPVGISNADRATLQPGPLIVISRHASLFDASLPGLIFDRCGFTVKGVIMAELLADPGFDLIYRRTGSVFIPRDDGSTAVAAIEAMAADADETTALVIFPEGRLFRPEVRDRLLSRLAETDPDRAKHLASLSNLLPPRPGGLLALFHAVPDADVVVLDHRGLDRFSTAVDLLRAAPIDEPVAVTARRIRRCEIPTDRRGQIAWLDQLWLDLDAGLSRDIGRVG